MTTTHTNENQTAVPAPGLATPAAVGPGSREICPFCNERTARVEYSSSAGKRAISMCCGAAQELIDNFDVLKSLPAGLMQVALDSKRAEYAAMDEQDREDARRFRESRDAWYAKYASSGLIKGE